MNSNKRILTWWGIMLVAHAILTWLLFTDTTYWLITMIGWITCGAVWRYKTAHSFSNTDIRALWTTPIILMIGWFFPKSYTVILWILMIIGLFATIMCLPKNKPTESKS